GHGRLRLTRDDAARVRAAGRRPPDRVTRTIPSGAGRVREEQPMDIALLIFPRLTALDAIGPYEVLQRLPGAQVKFVAAERGVYRTEQNMLGLTADFDTSEVTGAEILVVPGGIGTRALVEDEATLE